MSHARYEEWLAVYPDLTAGEHEEVDAHLATCAACAALLADYQALRCELKDCAAPQPSDRLHEGFRVAVARARAEDRRTRPWASLMRATLALGNAASWVAVGAVAVLLLVGLAITGPELVRRAWPATPTAPAGLTAGALMGSEWQLTAFNGRPLVEGTRITLRFGDRMVSGSAGCNGYGAEYAVMGEGGLTIGTIAVEAQLCSGPDGVMEQERAYIEALSAVASYRLDGGRLTLHNAAGDATLSYERSEPPQPPAPPTAPATSQPLGTPTPAPAPQTRIWGRYEIRMVLSTHDPNLSEVSVREMQTDDLELSITVPDVYLLHYHSAEFHNGHLYIIRRLGYDGYPDEDWTDELWRYDAQGQGSKLYSAQGLDFRVAPTEQGIALTPDRPTLLFLDSSGHPVQELAVEQLSGQKPSALRSAYVSPYGWADDGQALWAQIMRGPFEYEFSRVDVATWQVAAYDVASLPMGSDYALNPNTGMLAYSNAPVQLAVDPDETFWEGQRQVTLFVRDLAAQTSRPIAASVARAFRPRWLDDVRLEYNDPAGEGRVARGIAPTAPGEELTGLHMINTAQGWAVSVAGILRTEDSGAHWQDVTPPEAGVYVESLYGTPVNAAFWGAQVAWLALPQLDGKISLLRTTDGGQAWQRTTIDTNGAEGLEVAWRPQVLALTFADAQKGWLLVSLLGDTMGSQDAALYRTQDGGATWEPVASGYNPDGAAGPLPATGLPYTGIKFGLRFVDAQRGWLSGTSREDGIWLYASSDGGATWQQQPLVDPQCCSGTNGAAITHPPIFFNAEEGLLPVQFQGQSLSTVFYRTHDGGATWEPTTAVPSPAGDTLAWNWAGAGHGWASDGAGLYATQDGGHAWHLVAVDGKLQGATLLAFASPQLGWAVCEGQLLRTTDGGRNWQANW